MSSHDRYGSALLRPDELRDRMAALLGLLFVEREGLYGNGVHYTAAGDGEEEFRVVGNEAHGDDRECPYPQYDGVSTVVEVSETDRSSPLRVVLTAIADVHLLEHQEFEDEPPTAPRRSYDLYGSTTRELDDLRAAVAAALGVAFTADHDPLRGGVYYRAEGAEERYRLIDNRPGVSGTSYVTGFPGVITVLDVSGTDPSARWRERLAQVEGLTLVRHDEG